MAVVGPRTLNIRDALRGIVPNWLSDRQGFNVGFAILYVIALMCDFLVDKMLQGLAAAWPGAGTPTALYLVGQSRGLPRGATETDDEYAVRLRAYLDFWADDAGEPAALAQLVQLAVGDNAVVRVVDRHGTFNTCNADGSITTEVDTSWNWDETDYPERGALPDPWWSDLWVIVYIDAAKWRFYSDLSDSDWVASWGGDNYGLGMMVPRPPVAAVHNVVSAFKGAHNYAVAVIFANDTSLFVPGALGAYPDGHQANFSRNVAGVQTPDRIADITKPTGYWIFNNGA